MFGGARRRPRPAHPRWPARRDRRRFAGVLGRAEAGSLAGLRRHADGGVELRVQRCGGVCASRASSTRLGRKPRSGPAASGRCRRWSPPGRHSRTWPRAGSEASQATLAWPADSSAWTDPTIVETWVKPDPPSVRPRSRRAAGECSRCPVAASARRLMCLRPWRGVSFPASAALARKPFSRSLTSRAPAGRILGEDLVGGPVAGSIRAPSRCLINGWVSTLQRSSGGLAMSWLSQHVRLDPEPSATRSDSVSCGLVKPGALVVRQVLIRG